MTTQTTILPIMEIMRRLDSFIENNSIGTIFPENFFTSLRHYLGWQPIETAPRDGSFFMACTPGVQAEKCYYDQSTGKLCIHHLTFHTPDFSLWQPLAEAPCQTKQ